MRFPSGWWFFYLVTTGWIFDVSLCETLLSQSVKSVSENLASVSQRLLKGTRVLERFRGVTVLILLYVNRVPRTLCGSS